MSNRDLLEEAAEAHQRNAEVEVLTAEIRGSIEELLNENSSPDRPAMLDLDLHVETEEGLTVKITLRRNYSWQGESLSTELDVIGSKIEINPIGAIVTEKGSPQTVNPEKLIPWKVLLFELPQMIESGQAQVILPSQAKA